MASEEHRRKTHRKHGPKSTRRKDEAEGDEQNQAADEGSVRPQTVDELREARLAYLAQSSEERKMKFVSMEPPPRPSPRPRRTTSESKAPRPDSKRKRSQSTRAHAEPNPDSEDDYVYGRPEPAAEETERNAPSKAPTTRKPETPRRSQTRRSSSNHISKRTEERRGTTRRKTEPVRRRNSFGIDERNTPDSRRSPPDIIRPLLRKSATSVRDKPRPEYQRSPTSVPRTKTEVSVTKSSISLDTHKKGTSIFSSFVAPRAPPTEKKTSCLTCGDDAVPLSRSAKLSCSHRMCHSCLRRIFTMSVSDPAHMPPRCCTTDHIPLKHVDKLFDQAFKKTWNHKFQEYTTRNRIYCPARNCGSWIKPSHITTDSTTGRRIGKCKRCGTRVCCQCNNRAHKSSECPKDPATREFVEMSKARGWQRCYSCSAMVELKEGCNHMTCRCTAEFCMVCGVRWKGCDCPWFNYENFDATLGDPMRAQEALDRRREQERRDEALARRMETLGIDADGPPDDGMFGIGNGAGHHMNANFIQQAREALTANYQVAEQAARGLLNGMMTGRENRLPGPPLPPEQTTQLLRQPSRRVDAEVEIPVVGRPRRTPTHRRQQQRQSAVVDPNAMFDGRGQTANERAQDRRIQAWANGIGVAPG